jgi:uncharacterized membrane protein YkvA (DUF1232 family)
VDWWVWLGIALGVVLLVYAVFVGALLAAGRREEARAVAGFVPDCAVLTSRLLRDDRLPRRHKLLLLAFLGYLALPFDLVPDFIPVVGVLDDALLAAIVLRVLLRASGEAPLREHWPGPARSLELVLRLASR